MKEYILFGLFNQVKALLEQLWTVLLQLPSGMHTTVLIMEPSGNWKPGKQLMVTYTLTKVSMLSSVAPSI